MISEKCRLVAPMNYHWGNLQNLPLVNFISRRDSSVLGSFLEVERDLRISWRPFSDFFLLAGLFMREVRSPPNSGQDSNEIRETCKLVSSVVHMSSLRVQELGFYPHEDQAIWPCSLARETGHNYLASEPSSPGDGRRGGRDDHKCSNQENTASQPPQIH